MGFMDKLKDATQQAGDAAKRMGEAAKEGSDPRNIAPAQDLNRLGKEGVETTATLKSMTAVSDKKFGGGTEYQLEVDVQPPGGGEPYPATITQQLIEQSVAEYEKLMGGPIKVKVDPNDPQKMLLWG
jgi:hypothetical protein